VQLRVITEENIHVDDTANKIECVRPALPLPTAARSRRALRACSRAPRTHACTRRVFFTPTVSHCSMATLIGLCVRVQLLRALPQRFKVDVYVSPGSHSSEHAVNKQLNDKERVAAALENPQLLDKVNLCLSGKMAM
jgi:hypothetical protein